MPGWKAPNERKILGTRYTRLDGPIKATGRAKYSYDINLPGLLYGRVFRSPYASATIKSIDVSAAEKMPGVKAVIVTSGPGSKMMFQGHEIGGLCATSSDIAEDAIRAIKIEWDIQPHVVQESAAMKEGAPIVRPKDKSNVSDPNKREQGDVDAAMKAADVVSEGHYGVAVRTHNSLETHGVTCRWDDDQHLTCWASTQGVFSVRDDLAGQFKLQPDNVKVITDVMGGGFGSKFGAGYEGSMCAQLAKKANAPVKLLLTRYEEQLAVGNAPSAFGDIKIACGQDGKLAAVEAKLYSSGGIGGAGVPFPYIYPVPNTRVSMSSVYMNTGGARAWRAPGHPQGSWLMECAVEDLAVKLGMDPLEFRLKNDPNAVRQAQWKEGARLIGWDRRNPKPGQGPLAGNGRYKRGIGCGAATWGGGGGAGSRVRVTISRDGSVLVENGVQDIGTGTRTYMGAIVAEELGIPLSAVKVVIGRSDLGFGAASGGSVTTGSIAPPTKRAAEAAKQAMLDVVAAKMTLKADDLDLADGKLVVKTDPKKLIDFKDACAALPMAGAVGDGQWDRSLQQSGVAGAQFAEVEVDMLTGRVQPIKVVAIQDGGIVLNRLTFESQINGGVIQGIGMALDEDRHMCQITGRMVNPNMEEYKMPGPMEMPEFVPIAWDIPDATAVSGIGEPPVIPTAAAIRNAVLNATGAHVNEAPMTPARVLAALNAAGKRG